MLREEAGPAPLGLMPVKFLGGTLAIGAGLSLGREGPSVQMGAGIGHGLARLCRRPREEQRALLAACAGAGLPAAASAAFATFAAAAFHFAFIIHDALIAEYRNGCEHGFGKCRIL